MKDARLVSNTQTSQQLFLVSLYWDYQNVILSPNQANLLLNFIHLIGYVISKNVYYNSQSKEQAIAKHDMANLGFNCLDVPCPLKNSADNQLIADCLDHVHNSNMSPDIVVLISGDGDFVKLVHTLQKWGKKVIILSRRGNVKQKLKELADEFYFIDQISELIHNKTHNHSTTVESEIDYNQALAYLIEAIKTVLTQGKPTTFCYIDKWMRQRCSRYQGFSSISMPNGKKLKNFSQFVDAAVKDGKVKRQDQKLFLIEFNKLVA